MIGSTFKYIKLYKHLDRYENIVPLEQRKHRNCYREINENLAKTLIQKCHENNTTITGLLTATLSKATYLVINQNGKHLKKQLVLTPVSVRPRCEPAIEDGRIGCFVDFIESTLCFENHTSLWEVSRSFRNQIHSGIEQGGHMPVKFSKPFTIKLFSNLEKGIFKNIFHYGIGVTNIGRVDLPKKLGPFHIRILNLSTGRQLGDWLTLLHVASIENQIFLCFCYTEPLISEKTINNIADNMMSLLSGIV
ncbi:MAG: hypothetical protein KJ737_09600 [Proteobacteria bacterium]|nr:hypothetical protein [Pseudomonadota bacterium]